jgi:hypothetical protein
MVTIIDRWKRKARHEVSHAAVALHFGMFGDRGITIIENEEEAGSASIEWSLDQLRSPDAIALRTTVVMAGVAGEPAELRPELHSGQINWFTTSSVYGELRDDIEKARCLAWIARDASTLWSECIEPYLRANRKADLDLAVREVRNMPGYETNASYEVVQEPFMAAKQILAIPHVSDFVERATQTILDSDGELTSAMCLEIWKECVKRNLR